MRVPPPPPPIPGPNSQRDPPKACWGFPGLDSLCPLRGSWGESRAKLGQPNQLRSRASPKFQLHPKVSAAEHPRFGEEKLSLGFGSSRKGEKIRIKLLPSLSECPGSTSLPWECFLGGSHRCFWGAAGMGCAAAALWGRPLAVANPEAKSRRSLELNFSSFGIKGGVLRLLCGLCVQGGWSRGHQ